MQHIQTYFNLRLDHQKKHLDSFDFQLSRIAVGLNVGYTGTVKTNKQAQISEMKHFFPARQCTHWQQKNFMFEKQNYHSKKI